MKYQVYKVDVCKGSGTSPYYIKVVATGPFEELAFDHNDFDFDDDTYFSPRLSLMLRNGACVVQYEKVDNPGDRILSSITDDNTFTIEEIKTFESCSECNRIGVKLVLSDGTELYPSADLKDFEGREGTYVKIQSGNQIYCAYVDTYRYHTKEHSSDIRFISGCHKGYSDCQDDECKKEKYKEYYSGRKVNPEILTKPLSKC
jgi:hypothetical protein